MKKINGKLKPVYDALIEQGFILFIPIIIIKFFDLFIFNIERFTGKFEIYRVFGIIILNELIFLILYLLTIGLLLSLIKKYSKPIYWFLTVLFSLVVLFTYLVTSQYFLTAYLILDHVILYFTLDELLEIAASETGRLSQQYFWYYVIPSLSLILLLIFNKKLISRIISSKAIKLTLALSLIVTSLNYITKNPKLTDKQKVIAISKPKFLFSSVFTHLMKKNELGDISEKEFYKSIKEFREFMNWETSAYQIEYPFAREFNLEVNDLSSYFNTFENAPNLVIVFCEGLSSTFSGSEATLGSFTPHLDSLYAQSLYWPNAISNADRTHGVFANALASLPHGYERGMLNLKSTFPQHLSIPKLLISNNYSSSFTYGGWGYFDNFEPFLRMNHIQTIWDQVYIENNDIYKLEDQGDAFTWGIHDKTMVDLYFKFKDTSNTQPYFDLFITLSLHSPFNIPEKDKYISLAKERLKNVPNGDNLFENSKDVIAAVIYQDDALGTFMNEYKKRPEYENTIFLFVGDHNVNTLPLRTELDSHAVPLAIFSSKLKKAKQFKDIVAHTDIPQSLLTVFQPYLTKKEIPEHTNWLGNGLSTKDKLSSDHPIFIGRFNGEIIGVIYKDTILMNEELYKINPQLKLTTIKDKSRKKNFEQQLRNYKIMNKYVIDERKLLLSSDTINYGNKDIQFYFPEY